MDEMEKKEELEQETVVEETEELAEVTAEEAMEEAAADVTETEVSVEEVVEDAAETEEAVEGNTEKIAEKGDSNLLGMIVAFAALIAFLAFCWIHPGAGKYVRDIGVFYAKENDLYFYDLKNEPYLVQENISSGGTYHYYYSAWGAEVAENGDWAYYMTDIDATGAGDLYRKNAKDPAAEAEWIDSGVYDYMTSKDGSVAAYLAMQEDALQLRVFDGTDSHTVATGIHLEDNVYSLSGDGRYLVFKDAYDMLCAMEVKKDAEVTVLTDDCPLYALADETGILYFVSAAENSYSIYSYDFSAEPVLVAENVNFMELMPNGKDLLYGVTPAENVPYAELIEDDMAEIDAAMTENDADYQQKLMRDEIRAAMKNGEGIQPMLMEYYLLSNGKTTLVADRVISAAAAKGEGNFVTGYQAKEVQPMKLSVVSGGLEMVEMFYYMTLSYGGMDVFLADGNGNVEILAGSSIQPESVKVSSDGTKAAYLMENTNTGGNILMQMEIGKAAEAAAVQMNVEEFEFVGRNDLFCYYEYAGGVGKLAKAGDGDNSISAVSGVQFAKDTGRVYYLLLDQNTGHGKMEWWDGENRETIDGGVFAFQYKGNGKAALIYDYDLMKLTGSLGYYDGKGVTKLDEDITAIFID